jgi:hypothetical protein
MAKSKSLKKQQQQGGKSQKRQQQGGKSQKQQQQGGEGTSAWGVNAFGSSNNQRAVSENNNAILLKGQTGGIRGGTLEEDIKKIETLIAGIEKENEDLILKIKENPDEKSKENLNELLNKNKTLLTDKEKEKEKKLAELKSKLETSPSTLSVAADSVSGSVSDLFGLTPKPPDATTSSSSSDDITNLPPTSSPANIGGQQSKKQLQKNILGLLKQLKQNKQHGGSSLSFSTYSAAPQFDVGAKDGFAKIEVGQSSAGEGLKMLKGGNSQQLDLQKGLQKAGGKMSKQQLQQLKQQLDKLKQQQQQQGGVGLNEIVVPLILFYASQRYVPGKTAKKSIRSVRKSVRLSK